MAHGYKLKEVSPNEVRFSGQNPRGESEEEIKNDQTFEQLKDSVARFGVLVPIVVHEKGGRDGKKYTLVDGERRLRAALDTGVGRVPAHIAGSEDRMGEVVQAFHIHMLRKQWKPVAQARALQRIKKELQRRGREITDAELLEQLQDQTGCTDSQLKSLERGIRYQESTLKEVEKGALLWSHLVQFEASFVEQLEQHYPALLKRVGRRCVRQVLVTKAKKKVLTSTRALMENIVPIISRAQSTDQKQALEGLLDRFIEDEETSAEDVKTEFEKRFPPAQGQLDVASQVVDAGELLKALLAQVDIGELVSFREKAKETRKVLEELRSAITKKLAEFNKLMR
jgi:ParB/RepB/Spo0J family partition protein